MSREMHFKYGDSAKSDAPYHYTESGLDNVWLVSGVDYEEYDGEVYTRIHDMDLLHRAISYRLTKQAASLEGKEIRFLRKELNVTQAELAKLLGLKSLTVARWEKNEVRIPRAADLLLRAFTLCHLDGSVNVCEMAEMLSNTDEPQQEQPMTMSHADGNWHSQLEHAA